jgi:hypothetical protein
MASAHATTGTERRRSHALSGDGLLFRLADEIDALRQDLSRSNGQRSAKTLAKTRGLRLTLVVLDANATMAPEASAGWRKSAGAGRPFASPDGRSGTRTWSGTGRHTCRETCTNRFRRPNERRFW